MINKIIFIIFIVGFIAACDTYPDYEQKYSESYPLAGNYFVKDYLPDNLTEPVENARYYEIYIYDASFEAEKFLWVNAMLRSNKTFRVKTTYSKDNLSFNGDKLPHSPSSATPPDTADRYITVEQSSIIQKEWPIPDSISFKVSVYDEEEQLDTVFYMQGHRATGQEYPYWDNDEG